MSSSQASTVSPWGCLTLAPPPSSSAPFSPQHCLWFPWLIPSSSGLTLWPNSTDLHRTKINTSQLIGKHLQYFFYGATLLSQHDSPLNRKPRNTIPRFPNGVTQTIPMLPLAPTIPLPCLLFLSWSPQLQLQLPWVLPVEKVHVLKLLSGLQDSCLHTEGQSLAISFRV